MTASPFVWRRRVGMRDVDAWGVVWYGNYLGFCDEARAELLRAFGLIPGTFAEEGYIAPVVDVSARYHAPARYDEEIDIHVRLPESRGARLVFAFTIRRATDQVLLARISTSLVLLRTNGELVYLVPDRFKEAIRQMKAAQPSEEP